MQNTTDTGETMSKTLWTAAPINLERRESLVQMVNLALYSAAVLVAANGRSAYAFDLSDLSQKEASLGVKTALEKGAEVTVSLLGKADGFWGNDALRIPHTDLLHKAAWVILCLC